MIEAARRVLRDMAEVETAAASVADLVAGTLELVTLPRWPWMPLAEIVGRFARTTPA